MNILNVPSKYLIEDTMVYPVHRTTACMEDQAFEYFKNLDINMDYTYIPIRWTAYQIQANYGKDISKVEELKRFCLSLSKNCKYFTIVQYADGIPVEIPNCIVFSAGGRGDMPIPLSTQKHPMCNYNKEYLASFLGAIRTHKIRSEIIDKIREQDIIIENVQASINNTRRYAEITEKSFFTLCPRGYGKTSFRLYEAMQLGSVPVYISDDHWLPYTQFIDWSEFCVILKPHKIKEIPSILRAIIRNNNYENMREKALEVYGKYFSFESMFKWVIEILKRS